MAGRSTEIHSGEAEAKDRHQCIRVSTFAVSHDMGLLGIRITRDESGQFTYIQSKYEALTHASLRDTSIANEPHKPDAHTDKTLASYQGLLHLWHLCLQLN